MAKRSSSKLDAEYIALKCHTCGAPATVDQRTFNCPYCGSINVISKLVDEFHHRANATANLCTSDVTDVTGLVHAIEKLRSFTSNEIDALSSDLKSLEVDEARGQSMIKKCETVAIQAVLEKTNAWESFWVALPTAVPSLFILAAVIGLVFDGVRFTVEPSWIYGAFVILLIWEIFFRATLAILLAAAACWSLHIKEPGIVAILIGVHLPVVIGRLVYRYRRARMASISYTIQQNTLNVSRESAKGQVEENTQRGVELVKKHAEMIGVIRAFFRERRRYDTIKERLPIGIQMDDALSSLNDLTFGKIIDLLNECSTVVSRFESRSSAARDIIKTCPDDK